MIHAVTTLSRVGDKIVEIVQYPWAWLAGFGLFIADAVSGGTLIIYLVVIAVVIDLACGIAVAVSRKSFAQSELMRLTVEKVTVYGLALFVFLCVDKVIAAGTSLEMMLTSGVVGVVIALTEVWSSLASLLILFPKNPMLKLMQKALTGEIARKLGVEESEVKDILNASRRKRNPKRDANGRFIKKS